MSTRVGIGVSPSYPFHVETAASGDAVAKIRNTASDGYGFVLRNGTNSNYAMTIQNADASANVIQFFGTGNITCVSLTQTSDGTLKTNVEPLSNVMPLVRQLRAVNFDWADSRFGEVPHTAQRQHIGLIGQEVENIFPDLVKVDANEIRSVDYSRLSVILLAAIKELDTRLAVFEDRSN
jgi:hypothetical protein